MWNKAGMALFNNLPRHFPERTEQTWGGGGGGGFKKKGRGKKMLFIYVFILR
jgi:hypothetical protein